MSISTSISLTIILAICSAMVSNCFYLATSYTIKNQKVEPGEITVFSAVIRIFLFGIWSAKIKLQQMFNKDPTNTNSDIDDTHDAKAWLSLIVSNFSIAVTILLCYIAVSLMPLSDFVVFGFTTPVFTLLFVIACNR